MTLPHIPYLGHMKRIGIIVGIVALLAANLS